VGVAMLTERTRPVSWSFGGASSEFIALVDQP
jgi:hypothetical protein